MGCLGGASFRPDPAVCKLVKTWVSDKNTNAFTVLALGVLTVQRLSKRHPDTYQCGMYPFMLGRAKSTTP